MSAWVLAGATHVWAGCAVTGAVESPSPLAPWQCTQSHQVTYAVSALGMLKVWEVELQMQLW